MALDFSCDFPIGNSTGIPCYWPRCGCDPYAAKIIEVLDALVEEAKRETSQPSPVATRAETEAAPELVAEAQGHSHRPAGFRFRDSASKTGWGLTQSEDWAANADPNYQGLYVRDGR